MLALFRGHNRVVAPSTGCRCLAVRFEPARAAQWTTARIRHDLLAGSWSLMELERSGHEGAFAVAQHAHDLRAPAIPSEIDLESR
jgi:hypothetical protein